jgi:hypothetical protein
MYKKIVTLLAATAFMAVSAGQALAFFEDQSLIRVVYDSSSSTGKEVAYDLGNINSIIASHGTTLSTGSSILSDFGSVTADKLRVAYFAYDSTVNNGSLYSTAGATAPTTNLNSYESVFGAIFTAGLTVWSSGTNKAITTADNANSYVSLFNQGVTSTGTLSGSFPINGTTEASLANLATGVAQKLYFFSDANTNSKGVLALNLITNADGTTLVADATPTPIPPSFLLMGSGLLGMVGIRRKFNA